MPIKVEFQYLKRDMVRPILSHMSRMLSYRVVVVIAILFILFGVFAYSRDSKAESVLLIFGGGGLLLLSLPLIYLGLTIVSSRHARKQSQEWEFGPDFVVMRNVNGEHKLNWSFFGKLREIGDSFLLYQKTQPSCFQILPKRLFPDVANLENIRELLSDKIK